MTARFNRVRRPPAAAVLKGVRAVGPLLQEARTARKLSLEDASRATKIRARQLGDLERDEYTNFPNLAYAKGFLISYGKFLEVNVQPYLDAFADANTFGVDNYQYLSDVPLGVYRSTRRYSTRRRGSRTRWTLLASAVALLVFGTISWSLYVSYERLGNLDRLAERQEAGESGPGAVVSPAATAAPAPAIDPAIAASQPAPAALAFAAGPLDLPLAGDAGALRRMLPGPRAAQPPLLVYVDTSPAAAERGSWSPEDMDGYRFSVRSLDRDSVEIFRTGVPRPRTVQNAVDNAPGL